MCNIDFFDDWRKSTIPPHPWQGYENLWLKLQLPKCLFTMLVPQGLTRVKVHMIRLYSNVTRTKISSSILQTGTSIRTCSAVTAQGLSYSWVRGIEKSRYIHFGGKCLSHRVTHSSRDYSAHTHQADSRLRCSLEGIHRFHWCPRRRLRSGKGILLQTHTHTYTHRLRSAVWKIQY